MRTKTPDTWQWGDQERNLAAGRGERFGASDGEGEGGGWLGIWGGVVEERPMDRSEPRDGADGPVDGLHILQRGLKP